MNWLFSLLLGYVLGSIPFGLLLTKLTGAGDLRAIGSGNIGATNVLRTGRKGLAAATLLLDMAKGFIAVFLAGNWFPEWQAAVALAVVVGHCFPVWLKFRGGKGVATMAGVCFGLAWPIGAIYAVVWLGMLAVVRISSVSGLSAALSAPVSAAVLGYTGFVPWLAAIFVLVLVLHRENVKRLIAGAEPKVGGAS